MPLRFSFRTSQTQNVLDNVGTVMVELASKLFFASFPPTVGQKSPVGLVAKRDELHMQQWSILLHSNWRFPMGTVPVLRKHLWTYHQYQIVSLLIIIKLLVWATFEHFSFANPINCFLHAPGWNGVQWRGISCDTGFPHRQQTAGCFGAWKSGIPHGAHIVVSLLDKWERHPWQHEIWVDKNNWCWFRMEKNLTKT